MDLQQLVGFAERYEDLSAGDQEALAALARGQQIGIEDVINYVTEDVERWLQDAKGLVGYPQSVDGALQVLRLFRAADAGEFGGTAWPIDTVQDLIELGELEFFNWHTGEPVYEVRDVRQSPGQYVMRNYGVYWRVKLLGHLDLGFTEVEDDEHFIEYVEQNIARYHRINKGLANG